MKKALVAVGVVTLLAGCDLNALKFEGKNNTVGNIEEVLEDRLERENPTKDLEVQITEETKKSKSKSKSRKK